VTERHWPVTKRGEATLCNNGNLYQQESQYCGYSRADFEFFRHALANPWTDLWEIRPVST